MNKKDENAWRTITTPKEIEFYLQKRNQLHFGQAETDQTQFILPDMKHEFNWSASTNSAELVLHGEYTNQELDEVMNLLLDNMSRPTELDSLKATITKKEMGGKMKVWRETTTTSPSGRHLGHYKALFVIVALSESSSVGLDILSKSNFITSSNSEFVYSPFSTNSTEFVDVLQLNSCFISGIVNGV